MVRDAGAREVHFRSASPPIKHPDFYGIDMPTEAELMAATNSLEDMRVSLGANSLGFISIPGLYKAIGDLERNPAQPQYSDHCFTGDYPTRLLDHEQNESAKDRQLSLLDDVSLNR